MKIYAKFSLITLMLLLVFPFMLDALKRKSSFTQAAQSKKPKYELSESERASKEALDKCTNEYNALLEELSKCRSAKDFNKSPKLAKQAKLLESEVNRKMQELCDVAAHG